MVCGAIIGHLYSSMRTTWSVHHGAVTPVLTRLVQRNIQQQSFNCPNLVAFASGTKYNAVPIEVSFVTPRIATTGAMRGFFAKDPSAQRRRPRRGHQGSGDQCRAPSL